MSTHLINGKLKISLSKPLFANSPGSGNTFNIYLDRADYENLGSPSHGYLTVGQDPHNRGNPNALLLKLEKPAEGASEEARTWGRSGDSQKVVRLTINSKVLTFPIPPFMFRAFETSVTFDRDQRVIVFHEPTWKLWKIAEKAKWEGMKRSKGPKLKPAKSPRAKAPATNGAVPVAAKSNGKHVDTTLVPGGAFSQGESGRLTEVVSDFNRGLHALKVLGIPHETKLEDGAVVVEIKAVTLR